MTLNEIADTLDAAERIGGDKDSPEGSRFIQLSDTLAQQISMALRRQPVPPSTCLECGSTDIEYGRSARKGTTVAHCRHCKSWLFPPPPPPCRYINFNLPSFCPTCGSSARRAGWLLSKQRKCIQPECGLEFTT